MLHAKFSLTYLYTKILFLIALQENARFATRRSPTRDALRLAKFITKSASNAASVDKRSRGNSSKEAGNLTALNVTQ